MSAGLSIFGGVSGKLMLAQHSQGHLLTTHSHTRPELACPVSEANGACPCAVCGVEGLALLLLHPP